MQTHQLGGLCQWAEAAAAGWAGEGWEAEAKVAGAGEGLGEVGLVGEGWAAGAWAATGVAVGV